MQLINYLQFCSQVKVDKLMKEMSAIKSMLSSDLKEFDAANQKNQEIDGKKKSSSIQGDRDEDIKRLHENPKSHCHDYFYYCVRYKCICTQMLFLFFLTHLPFL